MVRRLVAIILAVCPGSVYAGSFRVGPTAGASLLSQRDTSSSHGSLVSEVTVGPTALIGLTAEMVLDGNDRVSLEAVLGPYGRDANRSCVNVFPGPPCQLVPYVAVSRGILYGMQYAHWFGRGRWRPYVSGGFGMKTYSLDDDRGSMSSPTVAVAIGAELPRRFPFRLEARGVLVRDNRLFERPKTQLELQLRAALMFPFR